MIKTTFLKYVCFIALSSSLCFGNNINEPKGDATNAEMLTAVTNLPYNLPLTADFTVMAKIKINISGSTLFSWSNERGQVFSSITITDDYKLKFEIPAIGYSIVSEASLESGCHHLAVVCDRGRITLYINGEEEISTQINLSELYAHMGSIDINTVKGNLANSGGFDISEFALFKDPLVQLVIQQLISSPPVFTSDVTIGLLLALNFNMPGMPFAGLGPNFQAEVCVTLSSDDLEKDALKVYPNPASDFVKVSKNFINTTYRVHDIIGKELISGKVDQSGTIDIKSLKNGVYFLNIDAKHSVKFIKK
ncbi:T9SS type A sorting domain-containing protein [Algibacter sp. 2305UL17-15]|uniref:T9SS type A sorting domain-containing protein n=1 Tax=Algibacter sp. 2305UL17-15 TaxID=3231268 RepID=UPI003457DDFD